MTLETKAELIVTNAAICTMDRERSWAQALAVAGGRITYVGTAAGATGLIGEATKVLDLAGKMVLPGIHDSHVHLVDGGVDLGSCNLLDCQTRQAMLSKIQEYAASHGDSEWICGSGWALPLFENGSPAREDLDAILPDKPAYFESQDYHSGWANSRALELAGITRNTPDPEGGRIERDQITGEPTGTLRESAMKLVSNLIPERSPAEYLSGLERGQRLANSFGITSIQDAWATDRILQAYSQLDSSGKLTLKVTAAVQVTADGGDGDIALLLGRRKRFAGSRLRVTSAKLFVDGVVESCTAALLAPYRGTGSDCGQLLFKPEELKRTVECLVSEGVQVHVHAIGDRAVRTALDAFEHSQNESRKGDLRHHIAHLEMVTSKDIPRFRRLSVSPNVQAFWAQRDSYIRDLTEPRLGEERSSSLYPIGSLAKSGALLVAGSDWPVSSLNPFDAIEVAIRRRAPGDKTASPWLPHESVDLATMLAAFTINGACVQHQEQTSGSLEVGKAADFVVLDRNLFEIPEETIHKTKVLWTVLDGQEVYRAPEFQLALPVPQGVGAPCTSGQDTNAGR